MASGPGGDRVPVRERTPLLIVADGPRTDRPGPGRDALLACGMTTGPEQPVLLYKLVDRQTWTRVRQTERWDGSDDDLRDGFVHLSTREQLKGTLGKHFAGRGDLLVLGVDLPGFDLRWEVSRGGALFPHLYEALPVARVRLSLAVPLGPQGHVLPRLPPSPAAPVAGA